MTCIESELPNRYLHLMYLRTGEVISMQTINQIGIGLGIYWSAEGFDEAGFSVAAQTIVALSKILCPYLMFIKCNVKYTEKLHQTYFSSFIIVTLHAVVKPLI